MPSFQRNVYLVLCMLCVCGATYAADTPELKRCSLVIGEDYAVVHEQYETRLLVGEQRLVFSEIPAEVDLASLIIKDRRVRLVLKGWQREPLPVHTAGENASSLSWSRDRGWNGLSVAGDASFAPGSLSCTLESPISGTRLLDVVYCVTGLSWRATYALKTRGDLKRTDEQNFAVDLRGTVLVKNNLQRTFSNATVYVSGQMTVEDRQKAPSGFLSLPESPLADLWRETGEEEQQPENVYAVQGHHTIPGCQETSLIMVDVLRLAARRYYWLSGDETASTARSSGIPLHEVIMFDNTKENDLGVKLPPGEVMVQRAGALRYQVSRAVMSHAQPYRDVHINIGLDSDVTATRVKVAKVELEGRTFNESYRIQLQNRHDRVVHAVIEEEPPTLLKWSVISVNVSYTRKGRVLEIPVQIPANRLLDVDYSIQVEQPVLW